MSEYQTHGFNVMFEGTFEDLIEELEAAGFDVKFSPPGLVGSKGTLIIEKTPTQKTLDQDNRPDL